MSFPEIPETEVAKLHEQFPQRSAEEIKQVLVSAKAGFHGSRGSTRGEIISRLLSDPRS